MESPNLYSVLTTLQCDNICTYMNRLPFSGRVSCLQEGWV
jgi:hypothetical protein